VCEDVRAVFGRLADPDEGGEPLSWARHHLGRCLECWDLWAEYVAQLDALFPPGHPSKSLPHDLDQSFEVELKQWLTRRAAAEVAAREHVDKLQPFIETPTSKLAYLDLWAEGEAGSCELALQEVEQSLENRVRLRFSGDDKRLKESAVVLGMDGIPVGYGRFTSLGELGYLADVYLTVEPTRPTPCRLEPGAALAPFEVRVVAEHQTLRKKT
jgi:hypothetical protein